MKPSCIGDEFSLGGDNWRRIAALGQLTPCQAAAAEAAASLTLEKLTQFALTGQPGDPQDDMPLTETETAIARVVTNGYTTQQIAARLGLSPATINSHLAHIRSTLGLTNRTELAAWAARHIPTLIPSPVA